AATTAVTPEAGSDALGGRVAMTARFLTQGSLHPFVDILWSFGTVGGEALQVWFYPFTGPRAARFLAASIVLILAFSRLFYWSKAGAILAPFMVSSLLLVHFVFGGIDTFQSFFWLASAWALFRAKQSKSLVFYAGFLASCAAAVKLNGLGAALAAALMLLFLYKRIGDIIRFGLWFSLGFTLGLAPWLGRSFFLTGNPLFPFFPAWFPNSIQNPPPISRFGVGLDWPNVLTVPWLIFAKPEKFVEVGGLNPAMVFILFLVLISLAWTRARALSAAALGTWLFWLLTEQNLRYSLAANFVTVAAASLCLVPPTLHLRKATIAAATLLGTLLAFPADYARPIGWIFRGAGGLPFPQELLAKNLTEPEYSAVNIPTYAPGQLVKASRHPWPQVCETGLRDHLYVPGTQPTNWHSLQPLSQWIAELHFAATVDAAARAARKLNCDFIMLHAGQFAALPSHRRPPVFSEAFWQRFGEVMGAVRQTVLLRRKGVPTHAFEGSEVQSFQVTFFSDHPLPPPGAAGTPLIKEGRLWSQPIPLKKAGLLRCQWIAGEASSGFLDVAARSAENRLLLFYRQDFSLEQNEIFVFYQTMPEQTATISISINGTFSLPELQCTVR
ncbi:MAG: hypothetical protein RMI39_05975, partial [Thermoanaerobaculum sp.]|nr:hypothetical protein [Thermoanaerobaculum sp.]